MANKNLHSIVALIKKMAESPVGTVPALEPEAIVPPSAPSATTAPATTATATTPAATGRTNVGSGAGKCVKRMQDQMKQLAARVTRAGLNTRTVRPPIPKPKLVPGGPIVPPSPVEPELYDENKGREAFNNFLTEHYIGTAKTRGVTGPSEPLTQEEQREHGGNTPTEMNDVLNTFKRMSAATNGLSLNGKWDDATNNGLLNIVAFAEALLRVEADLGQRAQGFDVNQLRTLSNLVPKTDLDAETLFKKNPNQAEIRANKLVPLLNNLRIFYGNFNTAIMGRNSGNNQGYIEGKLPFENYNKTSDSAKLNSIEQSHINDPNVLKSLVQVDIKSYNDKKSITSIPLSVLSDKAKFIEWAKLIGYTPQNASQLLVSIKGSIGKATQRKA